MSHETLIRGKAQRNASSLYSDQQDSLTFVNYVLISVKSEISKIFDSKLIKRFLKLSDFADKTVLWVLYYI